MQSLRAFTVSVWKRNTSYNSWGLTALALDSHKGDFPASIKFMYDTRIELSRSCRLGHWWASLAHVWGTHLKLEKTSINYIVIFDWENYLWESLSVVLKTCRDWTSRKCLNFNLHRHLWHFPLGVARRLGLLHAVLRQNWTTKQDLRKLRNFRVLAV